MRHVNRSGSNTPLSFPLSVIGPDTRPMELTVTVFDEVRWAQTAEAKKLELYDTAMMYGQVEYHQQFPIATITRGGSS